VGICVNLGRGDEAQKVVGTWVVDGGVGKGKENCVV
jgi:hypothetical protein